MILFLKAAVTRVKGYTRGDGTKVSPHIRQASKFAAKKHQGQFRGDGKTPYIAHPIGVAKILQQAGIDDPDTLIAAVLHDTIEDTSTTKREISKLFGRRVAELVVNVTNNPHHDKEQTKLAQITESRTRGDRANMIKVADKTYNLRDMIASPPNWTREKKIAKTNHAKAVVDAMPYVSEKLRTMFDTAYNEAMTAIS